MNQPLTKLEAIESRIDTTKVAGTSLTSSGGGLAFQNVTEAMEFAKLMAISDIGVRKHLRGNPGACLNIVVQAVEWGLSPYQVANRSYLVNDQLAYESALIQAVILKRAPIKGRIRFNYEGEAEQRVCVASAVDLSGDIVEYRSPPIGKITPKNSPLWKNDPDQQLAYYAGRALCRRHFPDVLLGIFDRDELEGAESIKDVTPKPSGLVARLKGESQGGFNPAGVAEALGDKEASPDATDGQETGLPPGWHVRADGTLIVPDSSKPMRGCHSAFDEAERVETEAGLVLKSKTVQIDPEMERAGATAAHDGEVREVPDDLSAEEQAAWLSGYDAVAGAEGGA